ncbi:C-type lectin domain family 4 member E-like isoform X2 [Megalobrama amblycephala]|uniref:C-type lectin domain family 4 member E-like isoform X2 n=1 Tax=Megalobrama amblycephala TaxID=75352 RepID=UPI002013F414|nr:C-type lectin domain family 4 member E-like isoform X2 [Megalobrama amblycephala]
MELEDFHDNKLRNNKNTTGLQRHCQDDGRAQNRRSRCLVVITVCLGILCLLLIAAIIYQHILSTSKRGYLWGPDGLFISNKEMSWSESRQYCRDRGADLVIIDTEEKQRHITSLVKESVWIGLSDIENEGTLIWVDNSPLNKGFFVEGQPNNYYSDEDCTELNPTKHALNNWSDFQCSYKKKGICEK